LPPRPHPFPTRRSSDLAVEAGDAAEGARAQAPVALYVHVPFCISLCPYCDFVVYPGAAARGPRNRIASFVAALLAELRLRADTRSEEHTSELQSRGHFV